MTMGALIVSVVLVGVVSAAKLMIPPLFKSNPLPPVVPMVNALMAVEVAPKVMLPIPSELVLPVLELMAIEVVLLLKKVAVSELVVDVEPGKVAAPLAQLVWPVIASQSPFVGVTLQVELAACAEDAIKASNDAVVVRANA